MTFESADLCSKIIDQLITAMKNKKVTVKLKALNVTKQVIRKGSQGFFKEMNIRREAIVQCLQYRGAPDPIYGYSFYNQIKDTALQVLNILDENERNPMDAIPPSAKSSHSISSDDYKGQSNYMTNQEPSNKISDYESNNYRVKTNYVGTNPDGAKLIYKNTPNAIGSYIEYEPSFANNILSSLSEKFSSIVSKISNSSPNDEYFYKSPKSFGNHEQYGQSSEQPSTNYSSHQAYGQSSVIQQPSINYSSYQAYGKRYEANPIQNYQNNQNENLDKKIIQSSESKESDDFDNEAEFSEDSFEKKLVQKLTLPSGIRAPPPRNDIIIFLRNASQIYERKQSLAFLIDALFECTSDYPKWQSKLKSLYFVEELLKSNVGDAKKLVFLKINSLTELTKAPQSSIREKSQQILSYFQKQESNNILQDQVEIPSEMKNSVSLIDLTPEQNISNENMFTGLEVEQPKLDFVQSDLVDFNSNTSQNNNDKDLINYFNFEPNLNNKSDLKNSDNQTILNQLVTFNPQNKINNQNYNEPRPINFEFIYHQQSLNESKNPKMSLGDLEAIQSSHKPDPFNFVLDKFQ